VRLMTRTLNSGIFHANKYGAVSYEVSGTNLTPVALTQLHRNGEVWAVTREFWADEGDEAIVVMGNVERRVRECLANSIEIARAHLGIPPPYDVEVGIVGLKDMRLSRPVTPDVMLLQQYTDRVHDDVSIVRKVLNDIQQPAQDAVTTVFLRGVYELGAIDC
jgi:hypothetical protein